MTLALWDASALAKRYFSETGTNTVNAIFQAISREDMAATSWGYAETYSLLLRKRNQGLLTPATFIQAAAKIKSEVVDRGGFRFLTISDELIFRSLAILEAHNLNSADAAILTTFLDFSKSFSETCLLVASDKRLLRAASAEGLATLNPESLPAADVSAFLATV